MLLAASQMSHSAQGICYLIALVVFIVAAVIAWLNKAVWATFIAVGLSLFALVLTWNQLALA
jgi:hypothetical protein